MISRVLLFIHNRILFRFCIYRLRYLELLVEILPEDVDLLHHDRISCPVEHTPSQHLPKQYDFRLFHVGVQFLPQGYRYILLLAGL